ncbi:hypothetical protein GCM10022384_42290 [Streptomyces marokkonensis]|uniref:Uncharacterized protein n=1 Tax=Streptomyces marokkonensis TaxID=324855 RepID=A0ABP7QZN2_9ACTN
MEAPSAPRSPAEASAATTAAATTEAGGSPTRESGESPAAESGETTAESSASEKRTAVAVATAPAVPAKAAGGVDSGRPRKPVLVVAGILGAALITVPLLLAGDTDDGERPKSTRELAAGKSDTVLDPGSAGAALDDYVVEKPTPTATEKKPEPSRPVKAVAPPPAPKPEPPTRAPSRSPRRAPRPRRPRPSRRPSRPPSPTGPPRRCTPSARWRSARPGPPTASAG